MIKKIRMGRTSVHQSHRRRSPFPLGCSRLALLVPTSIPSHPSPRRLPTHALSLSLHSTPFCSLQPPATALCPTSIESFTPPPRSRRLIVALPRQLAPVMARLRSMWAVQPRIRLGRFRFFPFAFLVTPTCSRRACLARPACLFSTSLLRYLEGVRGSGPPHPTTATDAAHASQPATPIAAVPQPSQLLPLEIAPPAWDKCTRRCHLHCGRCRSTQRCLVLFGDDGSRPERWGWAGVRQSGWVGMGSCDRGVSGARGHCRLDARWTRPHHGASARSDLDGWLATIGTVLRPDR